LQKKRLANWKTAIETTQNEIPNTKKKKKKRDKNEQSIKGLGKIQMSWTLPGRSMRDRIYV
jgi:hypothetical protein